MNTVTFEYGNKEITLSVVGSKDWKGARTYFEIKVDGKANPLRALYEVKDGTTKDKTIIQNGRTFGYEYGFCDSNTKRRAVDEAVSSLVAQIVK